MGNEHQTLYIGVTNDLVRRTFEHKQGYVEGFTKRYKIKNLLHYEVFSSIEEAILREKHLKHWNRSWKIDLIKSKNPTLRDIYLDIAC